MSARSSRAAALAMALLLAASQAGAQTASTAQLDAVAGQTAFGSLDVVENEHHALDGTLHLVHMPPDRPFSLHLADAGRCGADAAAASSAPAIVPELAHLHADPGGHAIVMFTLDKLTLRPGPNSIAGLPVGIYAAAEDGGALLACGTLGPKRQMFTVTTVAPQAQASLDDVRACMDSDDRIVRLVHLRETDQTAVDAARTADERFAASQAQAAHELQMQAYLKTHDQVCGKLVIGARERAAVLAERAEAASAPRP